MRKRFRFSPSQALIWLIVRQTSKGALIIGLLAGFMLAAQGIGYASLYPDETTRTQFAASLQSAPGLGVLYGEAKNLISSTGYMVYRVVPVMSLVVAVWSLLTTIALFRGQEEAGRFDLIAAGSLSKNRIATLLAGGFGVSIALACLLSTLATYMVNASPDISISLATSLAINLSIFLPALLFSGVGIFVSQLTSIKQRAVLYGLIPLGVFFGMRAVGNTIEDLSWLKQLTPFGWSELINPVLGFQAVWMLPFLVFTLLFVGVGFYYSTKRDIGDGLIAESTLATSRFFLLRSPGQLEVRQYGFVFALWGITVLILNSIISIVTNVAAQAVAESPALAHAIGQLGGSLGDLKIAFLGVGIILSTMTLLVMIASGIGRLRRTETRGTLDIFFAQPIHRQRWLGGRFMMLIIITLTITILGLVAVWLMADTQGIALELSKVLLLGVFVSGIVAFVLSIGILLYGLWPRVAEAGVYIVIVWSFLIDAMQSAFTLPDILTKTSLFSYIPSSPVATPDWTQFMWFVGIGAVCGLVGIVGFKKRDISNA